MRKMAIDERKVSLTETPSDKLRRRHLFGALTPVSRNLGFGRSGRFDLDIAGQRSEQGDAMSRRILYLQFADPAAYPPIEHSSEILAERGWEVALLGTNAFGDQNLKLPRHPRIQVKNLSVVTAPGGQRLQYLYFFLWSLCWTWTWRPAWIYASDPLALPALWLIRKLTKARVVYHEHDSPNAEWAHHSRFMRVTLRCRVMIGRAAELCVLPQQDRLTDFLRITGRTRGTACVWNCPRLGEIQDSGSEQGRVLLLYYHGSINSARVPPELIVAASRFKGDVRLVIAGYEAPGSIGYVDELKNLAEKNGVSDLVEFLGTIPLRKDLLRIAAKAHVGLSFMPKDSNDINLRHMVGASNKPFDCMACGLPLLVSDLPDWISTFVDPGYARACDPHNVEAIEAELRWYLENRNQRREMGRRCAEKIKSTWNYDVMFGSVLATIESA